MCLYAKSTGKHFSDQLLNTVENFGAKEPERLVKTQTPKLSGGQKLQSQTITMFPYICWKLNWATTFVHILKFS